jgi:hypothetical protein
MDNGWQFMALSSTFKKIINTNEINFLSFICNHVNNIRFNKIYHLALFLSALPERLLYSVYYCAALNASKYRNIVKFQ